MYAIIQASGRQLRVTPGSTVIIDGTTGDPGQEVAFSDVLLVERDNGDVTAGTPFVADAKVVGVVDGHDKGPKIRVFTKKRRKAVRRTRGHRTPQTLVRITEIVA